MDSRKRGLFAELEEAQRERERIDLRIGEVAAEIRKLDARRLALLQKPKVSEQAVLVFLAKRWGVDLVDVERDILTPAAVRAINQCESGEVALSDGLTAIVENKVIVTIR